MDFGKNRIQYKDFVWTYLDFERYRVYSYHGGNEIARYASYSVGKQLAILEKRLDYQVDDKINVIVYNNQGDFKQSNLGLSSDDQTNIGGVTRIVGDKISIFFTGSHADFDQQIRAALAELLISKILYGGNAREMVRNSTLLNIPEWYSNGLVKYLSEGWTTKNDNYMYDDLKNDNFNSFNRLTGQQAAQAGHALWYYMTSTFGESFISNHLYMTRVTRSPENAFITTLGVTLPNIINDFTEAWHRRIYNYKDSMRRSPINNNSVLRKYRDTRHYYQVRISPDARQVIYARNELNQIRVYLKDLETKKETRLLKSGPKVEQLADYNYPLLAFHPNGKFVTIIYEKKDELIIRTVELETKDATERTFPGFEKVNSFSYHPDGKRIVLSAVKKGKGQSDIFVFGMNSSAIEQLTNDIWDDGNPAFVRNGKNVVFESNRQNDTIKGSDDAQYFAKISRNMDLFMSGYPFSSKVLVRVTNTPDYNETFPQAYTKDYIAYLSDKNGIANRYMAQFDSSISFVDTTEHYRYFFRSKPLSNSDRYIFDQQINENATHAADLIYANGNDMLLVTPLPAPADVNAPEPMNTWYRGFISPAVMNPDEYKDPKSPENVLPQKNENTVKGIDFDNYKFDGEKENPVVKENNTVKKDTVKRAPPSTGFRFPIPRNYYTSFYTDYVVTQFDNSFLANNYQVFSGGGSPIYLNPGFNFLTKIAISDLFEDQRIIGGFRINPSLDNEFMLAWEQRKRLWDHQVVLDRQTFARVPTAIDGVNLVATVNTHTFKYSIKYPFSPVSAIRISALYRNDRKVPLTLGDYSLRKSPSYANMAGTRFEYIFDNTRKVMLNILNGFRFKVWTEYWMYTDNGANDLFTSGFDARHYLKIHRQITWCNRLAGGNSLGSKRLIFYLGGVDNWLTPTFNDNVNIVKPEQYGFQTVATNMRGFDQNIRNGNNFLVYNSELRVPLIRYFLDHPLRSDFLNNFQVIGFTDLGMAWYGPNPLSPENTENVKSYIDVDPQLGRGSTGIIVTVIDHKNPLVGGVGFGFRSRVLGYFIRLDFGWGIDNWAVQKKVVGLSLTTDF
jgi:Tol biopolymer transport system component